MSNVWFTSDLHFGHKLVSEIRGFATTEEHDAAVIESIITRLRSEDQLYILGDVTSGSTASKEAAWNALCTLRDDHGLWAHLVAGNHDDVHPMHSKAHKAHDEAPSKAPWPWFLTIAQSATRKINGHRVLLSHFPYLTSERADHSDTPRYEQWRLPDLGSPLLHGHTHLADQKHHRSTLGTQQIHVGWDAWCRPISINEVADLLGEA